MDWTKIPYFERKEFDDPLCPGSGDNISRQVLLILVYLRQVTGYPIVPHASVGGAVDMNGEHGHSTNSYHLKKNDCSAVDFHFDCDLDSRTQASWVLSSGFTGIGVYYDWSWGGEKLIVGFHGDTRPASLAQIWKRVSGEYLYFLQ